jgi:preprotein translocase subunit SecE
MSLEESIAKFNAAMLEELGEEIEEYGEEDYHSEEEQEEQEEEEEEEEEQQPQDINTFLTNTLGTKFTDSSDSLLLDTIIDVMSQHEQWMNMFHNYNGIVFILTKLIHNAEESGIQKKCIQILNDLIDHFEDSIDVLLESDIVVPAMSTMLSSEMDEIHIYIFQFLAKLCQKNRHCVWMVLEALTRSSGSERIRFKNFFKYIAQSDFTDDNYIYSWFVLMHSIIHGVEDLEQKQYLINILDATGLRDLMLQVHQNNDNDQIRKLLYALENHINEADEVEDVPHSQDLKKLFNSIQLHLSTQYAYDHFRTILRNVIRSLHMDSVADTRNLSLIASILNKAIDRNGQVEDILKQQTITKNELSRQSQQIDQLNATSVQKEIIVSQLKTLVSEHSPDIVKESHGDTSAMISLFSQHVHELKKQSHVKSKKSKQSTGAVVFSQVGIGLIIGAATVTVYNWWKSK